MFEPVLNESIIKRAQKAKKAKIFIHDMRDFTADKHRKIDDRPFGCGSGMVMRPEPIFNTVECIIKKSKSKNQNYNSKFKNKKDNLKIILLTPQGKTLTQKICKRLAKCKHVILICGHYEGIDERVRQFLVDEEISIGDYVLTGGELPAMVLIDSIVRLIPGVLGDKNSLNFESFEGNLLEYPHYTRPALFRGMPVPAILLSGDHKKVEAWRKQQALKRTKQRRPDLIKYFEPAQHCGSKNPKASEASRRRRN
jgi:tRNA (guanine37-N1)-methyltransferase